MKETDINKWTTLLFENIVLREVVLLKSVFLGVLLYSF